MSPKFSLGVALGFFAAMLVKHKPHRPHAPGRVAPPDVPKVTRIAGEAQTASRLAAIEATLDQCDRVILEQSKAAAARAFQQSAPDNGRLPVERNLASFRQEVDVFLAASQRATAACRESVAAWTGEVPGEIQTRIKAEPLTSSEEPDLDLPPVPPTESAPAEPSSAAGALAERLGQQALAIADVTAKTTALHQRLAAKKGDAIARKEA